MHAIYNFVSGPLAWVAFILFFGGILYQLISRAVLAKKKDPYVYEYWSFRYALRSILHWIVPFASTNSRKRPFLTIVTFIFHVCILAVPIFLFAHIALIHEAFNISWWFMPDEVADILTLVVIGACVFFLVRRIIQPDVKYLSSGWDYVLLGLVAAPFVSGYWAYHQWPGNMVMTIFHMLSAETLLAIIPFTKLNHMFLFFFTRGYMGSEFGGVRFAKDW
jgi:nitrate reductase gamma subunit